LNPGSNKFKTGHTIYGVLEILEKVSPFRYRAHPYLEAEHAALLLEVIPGFLALLGGF